MKVKEIIVKNIITKSNLPDADFVINPYTGCTHSCIYCYARFMKRFTGHDEKWGQFIDVKINGADLVINNIKKITNKSIFMSSVTDPYLPLEKKYKITRNILCKLVEFEPILSIQTKSNLVIRDIDVFKQFDNCQIGMTMTTLDENIRRQIEPYSSSVEKRMSALRHLKENGISTYVFIGPILPYVTNWKKIIGATRDFVDCYMFENLNMHGSIIIDIYNWLEKYHSGYHDKYMHIKKEKVKFWDEMSNEIEQFCTTNNIEHKMYFDHKKQRKN
jgi:DNA repair photolyase